MSRSYHIVATSNRLIKRIRPIEEKKQLNHEFRNSINTKDRTGLCDWCDEKLKENPLHFF